VRGLAAAIPEGAERGIPEGAPASSAHVLLLVIVLLVVVVVVVRGLVVLGVGGVLSGVVVG